MRVGAWKALNEITIMPPTVFLFQLVVGGQALSTWLCFVGLKSHKCSVS